MPFAVKVILVLISVFVLEFYFVKRVLKSIRFLFPQISETKIKISKWFLLILINTYPILAIISWISVYLTNSGYFAPPENFFFDYFILYPFWIGTMLIVQATLFFILFEILFLLLIPLVNEKNKRIKIKSIVFFLVFGATLIYVPIRTIYDYNSVEIRETLYKKIIYPKH